MRLFFALPLLFAACALSAQETTVAPCLTANAGTFSAPTVDLDGTVTIDATPITLSGISANTFAITIEAELPEGANGTFIGWQVNQNDKQQKAYAQTGNNALGFINAQNALAPLGETTSPLSSGHHIWTLTYDSGIPDQTDAGATLYEDGKQIARATGLRWSNSAATQITIGDSVADQPGPLAGMKVYAVHVEMGSTEVPEDTFTALYEVPKELSRLGEAALRHLMTQNGKVGDFSVPTVTLNGETLSNADAARALWLFGKTGDVTLNWHVSGLTLDENGVTLATTGDQPMHGALSVLEKAALNDTWKRVEATQVGGTLTVPAGGATAFYTVRAEEEAHEPGPVVSLNPTPTAAEGMPSQVLLPTAGTTPATATLFNFALDGTFEELGEAQRTGLTLTLKRTFTRFLTCDWETENGGQVNLERELGLGRILFWVFVRVRPKTLAPEKF